MKWKDSLTKLEMKYIEYRICNVTIESNKWKLKEKLIGKLKVNLGHKLKEALKMMPKGLDIIGISVSID